MAFIIKYTYTIHHIGSYYKISINKLYHNILLNRITDLFLLISHTYYKMINNTC